MVLAIIYKFNVLHVQSLYSVYLNSINSARFSIIFWVICGSHLRFRCFVVVSYFFHVGFDWIRAKQTQPASTQRGKIYLNNVFMCWKFFANSICEQIGIKPRV